MKRFIIICCCAVSLLFIGAYLYLIQGWHFGSTHNGPVETFVKQDGKTIYLDQGDGYEPFEIRGVNMGAGIPGHYATDYAVDKETYLRWFDQIKEMGANTIRVYILQGTAFYEALYEYNTGNSDPLYVLHGVWIEDYVQNSHLNAYDTEYLDRFIDDVVTMIDVIHGNRFIELGDLAGTGFYTKDISPWVIGYILGVEWEAPTVAYTDLTCTDRDTYKGEYLSTTADASPFEAMLARVGDRAFSYESDRYGEQRLVAFSNWATTDPFEYTGGIEAYYDKYESVDVEHIALSEKVVSGTFASYHVYPYFPDYLRHISEYWSSTDPHGNVNTYYTYLKLLNEHHTVPVIIAEFGVSTGRGMAQTDANTGRNQGNMSEEKQGLAIVQSYRDIREAGCAGSIIFSWQDEWFKRTWNTMAYVDLQKTPYWSDYQTNEQYFGLLSFDPGNERSVSYVDGDDEEWSDDDIIGSSEGNTLSMKYDEKFMYFMVRGDDIGEDSPLYLPIDTTQKSGSTSCAEPNLSFNRAVDFLIAIDGQENSRLLVQERYNAFRAVFLRQSTGEDPYVDPPSADSRNFVPIELLLQSLSDYTAVEAAPNALFIDDDFYYLSYETGKLTYGDANPAHENFNSLADFCFGDDFVEIKIPWQLLNFGNPAEMQIHDDYYENWGVEFISIDSMYIGVGTSHSTISLHEAELKGWGRNVTYHDRLKQSYYIVQQLWAYNVDATTLLADNSSEVSLAKQLASSNAAIGDTP